jgi:hypothetical protein
MEKLTSRVPSVSLAARNFNGDRPSIRFALPFFRWCVVVRFCENAGLFSLRFSFRKRAPALAREDFR